VKNDVSGEESWRKPAIVSMSGGAVALRQAGTSACCRREVWCGVKAVKSENVAKIWLKEN
jgi:hypothetical protein